MSFKIKLYHHRTKARIGGDSATALAVKREDKWVKWSYSEYLSEVEAAARAFIALGLEPRHGVAIIGFNSPEVGFLNILCLFHTTFQPNDGIA